MSSTDGAKKRKLKVAARCTDCKQPVDDCVCRQCVFCENPVTTVESARRCETAKCREPFLVHRKCLATRSKRLRIKCTACGGTTTFEAVVRKPIWQAAWFVNPVVLAKLIVSFGVLSFLPYYMFYYLFIFAGKSEVIGENSLPKQFALSWMLLMFFYVLVSVLRIVFLVVTFPFRRVTSWLLGVLQRKEDVSEEFVVAYKSADT